MSKQEGAGLPDIDVALKENLSTWWNNRSENQETTSFDLFKAGYQYGAEAEQEKCKLLRDALGIAEKAIEALATTQVEQGIGLVGRHILVPESLRQIRAALKEATSAEGEA